MEFNFFIIHPCQHHCWSNIYSCMVTLFTCCRKHQEKLNISTKIQLVDRLFRLVISPLTHRQRCAIDKMFIIQMIPNIDNYCAEESVRNFTLSICRCLSIDAYLFTTFIAGFRCGNLNNNFNRISKEEEETFESRMICRLCLCDLEDSMSIYIFNDAEHGLSKVIAKYLQLEVKLIWKYSKN